jgi:hypothetical protein
VPQKSLRKISVHNSGTSEQQQPRDKTSDNVQGGQKEAAILLSKEKKRQQYINTKQAQAKHTSMTTFA